MPREMSPELRSRVAEVALDILRQPEGGFFETLLKALSRHLDCDFVFIGELQEGGQRVRTVCLYERETRLDDFEYSLPDSPCEEVISADLCIYPQGVTSLFPKDSLLAEMCVEAYAGVPLPDQEGNPIGLLVALSRAPMEDPGFIEIALRMFSVRAAGELARLRSARQLTENEESFRLLYEEAPLPYQSLDYRGRLLHVNEAWLAAFGFDSEAEVIGRPITDFIDSDYLEAFLQRFPAFKETGFVHDAEFRMVKKDGSCIDVTVEGRISHEPDGAFRQTHCVLTDVTDRLRASKIAAARQGIGEAFALSTHEDVFGRVVELVVGLTESEYGFFGHFGPNGDLIIPSLTSTIWDQCAVEGKSVYWPHEAYRDNIYGRAVVSKRPTIINEPRATPDGHVPIRRVMLAPLVYGDVVVGLISVANKKTDYAEDELELLVEIASYAAPILKARLERDAYEEALANTVSELESHKEHLEELVSERTAELEEANAELAAATEAKSDFLASMSHELRTPLNSVIGFSGTLLQGLAGELNDEQQRQVEMISSSGKHLLTLINDVLDISKVEAGALKLSLQQTTAGDAVDSLVASIEPLVLAKGLELKRLESCPDIEMLTDRTRLQQVLLNLASNAVKFTQEGSVTIDCSHDESAETITFSVIDTGIGISEKDLPLVFDRFVQISSGDVAKPKGTGLGLSLSKSIAELLGGEITVESEIGKGSTFSLTIPRHGPPE